MTHGRRKIILQEFVQRMSSVEGLIADIGTPQRFHKELREFKHILSLNDYRAFGFNPRLIYGDFNCDGHQDIENLTFESDTVSGVICLDVLEHVKNPFRAAEEIIRVLKPGGYVLLSVPFLNSYHGKSGVSHAHDSYPDLWRFTHEGLEFLFKDLKYTEIQVTNGPIEYRLRQIYLGKILDSLIGRFILNSIDIFKLGKSTSGHILFGIK